MSYISCRVIYHAMSYIISYIMSFRIISYIISCYIMYHVMSYYMIYRVISYIMSHVMSYIRSYITSCHITCHDMSNHLLAINIVKSLTKKCRPNSCHYQPVTSHPLSTSLSLPARYLPPTKHFTLTTSPLPPTN